MGAPDDLVVNIGDIAHVGDLKAAVAQIAHNHVEIDKGARVTDVTEVVNGDSADVKTHLAFFKGYEILLLTRQRIVNLQHGILTF